MAFYKLDNGELLRGENFVYSPTVTLKSEEKDTYEYPQDGWYWFDTIEEAMSSLSKKSNTLTPQQFHRGLYNDGLYDKAVDVVSSNFEYKLFFDKSIEFDRNHPLLVSMAKDGFGMSDEQIDSKFAEWSKL